MQRATADLCTFPGCTLPLLLDNEGSDIGCCIHEGGGNGPTNPGDVAGSSGGNGAPEVLVEGHDQPGIVMAGAGVGPGGSDAPNEAVRAVGTMMDVEMGGAGPEDSQPAAAGTSASGGPEGAGAASTSRGRGPNPGHEDPPTSSTSHWNPLYLLAQGAGDLDPIPEVDDDSPLPPLDKGKRKRDVPESQGQMEHGDGTERRAEKRRSK